MTDVLRQRHNNLLLKYADIEMQKVFERDSM